MSVKRKLEESAEKPSISFHISYNDPNATDERLRLLVDLKNIISQQLPKMPKEYITRLVMDRNHRSICLVKTRNGQNTTIGGICFRPFHTQGFCEIVFLAVTGSEQVKGYGRRMMNNLKEHVKKEGIQYFLTYADNYAIGFFKKQGFAKRISMPRNRWAGFIKDYDGANLMECKICHKVSYLDIQGTVAAQRNAVYKKIHMTSRSHAIFSGLQCFKEGKKYIPIDEIKGVSDAGWTPPPGYNKSVPPKMPSEEQYMIAKIYAILKGCKSVKDSWPFHKKVEGIKDYHKVIKHPMDFGTMQYQNLPQFHEDAMLVFDNCRTFNQADTSYYRCADLTQEMYEKLLRIHFKDAAEKLIVQARKNSAMLQAMSKS